jgi:hypothetical protein
VRLSNICSTVRLKILLQDLQVLNKRVKWKCKKTKLVKIKKLEKTERKNSIGKEKDSWLSTPYQVKSMNLGQREKDIINKNHWLIDKIMDAAPTILKRDHPLISGLIIVSFSEHGFDWNPLEGIQMHCVNGYHWVSLAVLFASMTVSCHHNQVRT